MNNIDKGKIVGIIGAILLLGTFVELAVGNILLALVIGGIGFFAIMISSTISTGSGIVR